MRTLMRNGCVLVILLGCVPFIRAEAKPLTKEEQAKIDKAIQRGVEFLKSSQSDQGTWPGRGYGGSYPVGQCALPAYALLEAGAPASDPVIQKTVEYIRSRILGTDQTYELSLGILFFDRLGDPKDELLIQTLALRLIAGQHRTGGWSYRCLTLSEKNEQDLLKSLGALSKRMEGKEKARDQALAGLEIPPALQLLTVFQRASALSWREPPFTDRAWSEAFKGTSLDSLTDNSNTQFALLGLWVAQRHGIPTEAAFEIMVERFERSQVARGGFWIYLQSKPRESVLDWHLAQPWSTASMTCVGLLGLAIGRGLKLPTPGSPTGVEKDVHVLKGLAALRRFIGKPLGHMNKRVPLPDLYFLWSLERVGMLYNLPTIGDRDWYRWGAESLVTNQLKNGAWPGPRSSEKGVDYFPAVNTTFALLFLKKAHPMQELTSKLPFTAKELNEGIARLRPEDKFPLHPVAVPSQSRRLEGTINPPSQSNKPKP